MNNINLVFTTASCGAVSGAGLGLYSSARIGATVAALETVFKSIFFLSPPTDQQSEKTFMKTFKDIAPSLTLDYAAKGALYGLTVGATISMACSFYTAEVQQSLIHHSIGLFSFVNQFA